MILDTPELVDLALDQLHAADDNVRKNLGDVKELAASIKAVGILEPIVVVPNGDGYTIVAGARRHAAAKVAKLSTVPCVIRPPMSVAERVEAMVIENLQRVDLTPLEEADAYQRLVDLDWTQRKIAERVGTSQPHVSKRLKLTKLAPKARTALEKGAIRIEDALELADVDDQAIVAEVLKSPRNVGWQIERLTRDRDHAAAETVLREQLEAKGVRIVKDEGYSPRSYVKIGKGWRELDVDRRKHAKEPCHAVVIGWNGYANTKPAAAHVCTDHKRHAAKGASELKGKIDGPSSSPSGPSKAEADKRKSTKARKEFLTELLATTAHPLPRAELVDLVLRRYVDDAASNERNHMAKLLGLEAKPTKNGLGWDAAIDDYIAASESNLLRAALAFVLVQGDARQQWSPDSDLGIEHRRLLVRFGYEPLPHERRAYRAAQRGIAPDDLGTVVDPDAPSGIEAIKEAQARDDADFVEANDLQPGDDVHDDGTITRATA